MHQDHDLHSRSIPGYAQLCLTEPEALGVKGFKTWSIRAHVLVDFRMGAIHQSGLGLLVFLVASLDYRKDNQRRVDDVSQGYRDPSSVS
ncbi:hypothetical protein JAAARDRAFT_220881 [Jaapia argillacea MUCL 33604]|uniref:Uncharacterized protein n=1 Tax=Jaapia argillacea MUCL 33604 TaxID=933084 RepID=A0A067QBA4_9AGAM|nr:hypothetical protein JAAARDRAFT_220881 [Jaapia argillacea MUCL 33604]